MYFCPSKARKLSTSNDEAVAVFVEGARRLSGVVVALRGERAHAVEHGGELVALVLASAAGGIVNLSELGAKRFS